MLYYVLNFYEGDIVVDYLKNKQTSVCPLNIRNLFTTVHFKPPLKTITSCTFHKPFSVVGITILLLFVIPV